MTFMRLLAGPLAIIFLGASASAEIVTLTPYADTYVEVGGEATWNHGRCTYFDLDTKPWGVAYLSFDVSSVDPRSVLSVTLTLQCSNSSNDGGTIYPVPLATAWDEGNGCGPGGGGLKWADIDCTRDGKITAADQACSSLAPDFSRPIAAFGSVSSGRSYSRDVTAAFQESADVLTLAIANESSDGATYRSKDYATEAYRPRLVFEIADLPPPPSNDLCVLSIDPDLGRREPTVVTSTPFSDIVDTRSASTDDGDPDLACSGGRPAYKSVWYVYTPPTDGILAITTRGSDYDTGMAVFTGTCGELTETLHEVACDGDACDGSSGGQPSRLSFPALAGVTYWIMVIDESHAAFGGSLHFALHFNECAY